MSGRRCVKRNRAGNQCGRAPIKGATVCASHGGAARQVRRRAMVRAELAAWGVDDTLDDPGMVLLRLVTQSSRRAELYSELLAEQYERARGDGEPSTPVDLNDRLGTTDLPSAVSALIGHKVSAAGKDGDLFRSEEMIRGLVDLESQERDRCARFAKLALDAGIAERQVRLAEAQGVLIANVLRAVFADAELDLTEAQRSAVVGVARRHLLSLTTS